MASAYQQTVTKWIKMVVSVKHFCQRHWSHHWYPISSGSSSNNSALYLHIQRLYWWARCSISPSCHPETVRASSTTAASHEYGYKFPSLIWPREWQGFIGADISPAYVLFSSTAWYDAIQKWPVFVYEPPPEWSENQTSTATAKSAVSTSWKPNESVFCEQFDAPSLQTTANR